MKVLSVRLCIMDFSFIWFDFVFLLFVFERSIIFFINAVKKAIPVLKAVFTAVV